MVDLGELADSVHDEKSFVAFVQALKEDWLDERRKEEIKPSPPHGSGANGWENGTIEGFLDAAAAWAMDTTDPTPFYRKPENPWTRAAQILHAGKIYE